MRSRRQLGVLHSKRYVYTIIIYLLGLATFYHNLMATGLADRFYRVLLILPGALAERIKISNDGTAIKRPHQFKSHSDPTLRGFVIIISIRLQNDNQRVMIVGMDDDVRHSLQRNKLVVPLYDDCIGQYSIVTVATNC